MSDEHHDVPYYKVLAWLTVLTVAEIAWALIHLPRSWLIIGLGAMAAVKAVLVAMYYMHLKYDGKILVSIILFPVVLAIVMVCGLLPDAVGYY